jgi:hypothetical protein
LAIAESKQDLPLALHAAEQIRRALEVLGKITGEIPLTPTAAVAVNQAINPVTRIEIVRVSTERPLPQLIEAGPEDKPN